MRTGSINGTIYGNEWQTIYDSGELGSSATSLNITDLNGNLDKEYRLICRFVSSSNSSFVIGPNGDYYNNGLQQLTGNNSSAAASRQTSDPGMYVGYSQNAGEVSMSDTIIYAKSGFVRTGISTFFWGSGTTVTQLNYHGWSWNNTADNITSLLIGGNMAAGTRIILMRRADRDASTIGKTGDADVYGRIKGCFQKIYENNLSAPATSMTISGLDGNTDVLYRLMFRGVNGYNGASAGALVFNGDVGTNYGYQRIYGSDTSPGANRYGTLTGISFGNWGALNQISMVDVLIHAKSGYVRTGLMDEIWNVNETTISAVLKKGLVWNNTASNLTSITIDGGAYINLLGTGTVIELWAYRP